MGFGWQLLIHTTHARSRLSLRMVYYDVITVINEVSPTHTRGGCAINTIKVQI